MPHISHFRGQSSRKNPGQDSRKLSENDENFGENQENLSKSSPSIEIYWEMYR